MKRREFIKTSSTAALVAGFAGSVINPQTLFAASEVSEEDYKKYLKSVKKDVMRYACSGALFLYLNRNFGYPKEDIALSTGSLSGGILQEGYQCGMLWGSSLALGAESYRRHKDHGKAVGMAILVTHHVMKSFSKRTKCITCRDITNTDWSKKGNIPKYILSGKMFKCLSIAKRWAPEAFHAANNGLSSKQTELPEKPLSCASEVAKKMGVSEEEVVMVAGLAGGMGLSGSACGALGAAVWIKTMAWFNEYPENKNMYNPYARETLKKFYDETGSKMLCQDICGKRFKSLTEHTEYVKNGGCAKLIDILANS